MIGDRSEDGVWYAGRWFMKRGFANGPRSGRLRRLYDSPKPGRWTSTYLANVSYLTSYWWDVSPLACTFRHGYVGILALGAAFTILGYSSCNQEVQRGKVDVLLVSEGWMRRGRRMDGSHGPHARPGPHLACCGSEVNWWSFTTRSFPDWCSTRGYVSSCVLTTRLFR